MIALVFAALALQNVDIEEHLGQSVPSELALTDGRRPTLLVLSYFRCASLCDMTLQGMVSGIGNLTRAGFDDFSVVTVSIDPTDTRAEADRKRAGVLGRIVNPPRGDWRFVLANEPAIHRLADRLGFRYVYEPRTRQFAHPAGLFVLTPEGRISRTLYGVEFPAKDLRLALVEASQGRIGTIVDRVLLRCYRFDPSTHRYGLYVAAIMKGGSAVLLLILGLFFSWAYRVERRRHT